MPQCCIVQSEVRAGIKFAILEKSILMSRKASWGEPERVHLSHLEAETHSSTSLASRVNWLRIWEAARDRGPYWTTIAQSFYRLLTTPLFGDRTCWKCSDVIPPSLSFIDHLTSSHCINSIDLNDLLSTLSSDSDLSHSLSHPFHCMKVIVSSYRAA